MTQIDGDRLLIHGILFTVGKCACL